MSSNQQAVYTSSTPGYENTVHFGYTATDRNYRTVIYTGQPIHVLAGTPNNETMFYNSPYYGIQAVCGAAEETTLELVRRLVDFSQLPFDRHVGIRISESDNPLYASKIVFRRKASVDLNEIFYELADTISGEGSAVVASPVADESPSLTEQRDMDSYNMLD